jgi:hypothetical protein
MVGRDTVGRVDERAGADGAIGVEGRARSLGLVSPEVYTMMVLMALATTVMAVPALALMQKGAAS